MNAISNYGVVEPLWLSGRVSKSLKVPGSLPIRGNLSNKLVLTKWMRGFGKIM
jgi:hypothetical protein